MCVPELFQPSIRFYSKVTVFVSGVVKALSETQTTLPVIIVPYLWGNKFFASKYYRSRKSFEFDGLWKNN